MIIKYEVRFQYYCYDSGTNERGSYPCASLGKAETVASQIRTACKEHAQHINAQHEFYSKKSALIINKILRGAGIFNNRASVCVVEIIENIIN